MTEPDLKLRAEVAVEVMSLNILGLADVARWDGSPCILGLVRDDATDTSAEPVFLSTCYCGDGWERQNDDLEFKEKIGHCKSCCEVVPIYELSLDACREVLREIERRGLMGRLAVKYLVNTCNGNVLIGPAEGCKSGLNATAADICRAALAAIRENANE